MTIDTDVKHQLIMKLAELHFFQSYETRTNLLDDLPSTYLIHRVENNASEDLRRIFDFALLIGRTEIGTPALEIVHRNTMRYVPIGELSTTIEKLFDELLPLKDDPKAALDDGIPFVNRQDELNNILSEMAGPYHVIEAPAGFGKTKIMRALQMRFNEKEKNYLCGFASALNKQSFINVITNLCESMQLPDPTVPSISELPKEEEKLLELARDLGSKHASQILGKYFTNIPSSETFAGVVIVIDDLDRIIKEAASHRLLIEQVKLQIRLLVYGYIRAMQEGLSIRTPFLGQNRFRVVLSLRYLNEYSDLVNYLPFHEMALRPFEYSYVSETVVRLLKEYDQKDLKQISAHVLHLTGGHPECIIDLIQRYNNQPMKSERYEKIEYAKDIWNEIIKPRLTEIKNGLPESLRSIFLGLSFYRVFNTAILGQLIQDGYLITDFDRHELADLLTLTYLYQRRGQLLSDSITRRLFAIEQRYTMAPEDFKNCCMRAYDQCMNQLDDVRRQSADEWVLECFYQFLQSGTCNIQDISYRMAMGKTLQDEIIPQVMKAYAKNSSDFEADRSLLVQKIRKDWELVFTVNYYLRDKDFDENRFSAFLTLIMQWQPPVS